MIFVDTNVVMYAVGRAHPLRTESQKFFADAMSRRWALATSAEVLQELLHAYMPVERLETLDRAYALVESMIPVIWAVERDDVMLARTLAGQHPGLGARDLIHLATCRRHDVEAVRTYDRSLAAAFAS